MVGSPITPTGEGFTGEADLSHRARRAVADLSQQAEIER
jgi:hypothetical protein